MLFGINILINYKAKCLAIPLIQTSEYLKYSQKKENMNKFFVNFILHEENW